MSDVDDVRAAGLPDGMADGLRDLARARTAGTTPWPRVRTAVRRDRRRRAVGASAAAAGLVAATILAAGTLLPDSAPPPTGRDQQGATPTPSRPDPSPTPTASPRTLGAGADPLDLTGPTAGSLAGDEEWLGGLREHVTRDRIAFGDYVPDVADVRVLWAADHAGGRHALTLTRRAATTAVLTLWRGDAGAAPGDLRVEHRDTSSYPAGKPFVGAMVYQIRKQDRQDGPGLFVATGTDLMAVETSMGTDYDTAGRRTIRWAPLQPQGAVFVREASDAELDSMVLRAAGTDGRWFRADVSGSGSSGPSPSVPPALVAVSPAGANQKVLTCATRSFARWHEGAFPAGSDMVLGATPKLGDQWIGIAVARAPSGGFLVGLCRTSQPDRSLETGETNQGEGFVVPAPAAVDADDLLILVPCKRGTPLSVVDAVCVVAPGAAEVEVGGVRADVRDGIAVVEFPQPRPVDELRATARRADGESIGPVRRADGEEAVTEVALPPYDPRR